MIILKILIIIVESLANANNSNNHEESSEGEVYGDSINNEIRGEGRSGKEILNNDNINDAVDL